MEPRCDPALPSNPLATTPLSWQAGDGRECADPGDRLSPPPIGERDSGSGSGRGNHSPSAPPPHRVSAPPASTAEPWGPRTTPRPSDHGLRGLPGTSLGLPSDSSGPWGSQPGGSADRERVCAWEERGWGGAGRSLRTAGEPNPLEPGSLVSPRARRTDAGGCSPDSGLRSHPRSDPQRQTSGLLGARGGGAGRPVGVGRGAAPALAGLQSAVRSVSA